MDVDKINLKRRINRIMQALEVARRRADQAEFEHLFDALQTKQRLAN
jgi:hypothetical protein